MTTPIETLEALSKHAKQVLKNITVEDLVEALRLANEKYRNDEETLITDALYDMALEHLEKIAPNHPFLSEIGASVKGEKVKIPYWMGSLDKIKDDAKTIEKWRKTYPGECVISDKLDGISALLVFRKDKTINLYTRGTASEGLDISPLIKYMELPKINEDILKKYNLETV